MKYVPCKSCGTLIDTEAPHGHDCKGAPSVRLDDVEARAEALDERVDTLSARVRILEASLKLLETKTLETLAMVAADRDELRKACHAPAKEDRTPAPQMDLEALERLAVDEDRDREELEIVADAFPAVLARLRAAEAELSNETVRAEEWKRSALKQETRAEQAERERDAARDHAERSRFERDEAKAEVKRLDELCTGHVEDLEEALRERDEARAALASPSKTSSEGESMKYIYKYKLEPGPNTVALRKGWVPLSIQPQGRDVCLWAIVDTKNEKIEESILLVGTGHELPQGVNRTNYLGTAQTPGSSCFPMVWHAFLM